MVEERLPDIDARAINTIPLGVDADGREIVVRVGRYGPYLSRGEATAPVPDDVAPDELTSTWPPSCWPRAPKRAGCSATDPETGLAVTVRDGRYGPYVQLGEPEEGSKKKPKRASLFKTMTPDSVTLGRGPPACSASPGWWAWTRTAPRSSPARAASGPT